MASRKATKEGIVQIKQAIAKKGWKVYDDRWLLSASQLLEPDADWQEEGPYAYGCSAPTWERFLRGIAIRDRSFNTFCKILDLDPDSITKTFEKPTQSIKYNRAEVSDEPIFYGRNVELETLGCWICKDGCQLVAIAGLAGTVKR